MTAQQQDPAADPFSTFDFHQLLVPTPPADSTRSRRDNGTSSSAPSSDADSFFVPEPLSRSNSIYSFSRASLGSQLAGLTSMTVPQAESLAATITALPTARKACKALQLAAEQISSWNRKALRVLKDLDADDDVEWAAAAGRDALEETDKTINKFENLINVYVVAIEELQARPDVGELKTEELTAVVEHMETTLIGWDDVRKHLKRVHEQVELAMEWEELWNTVLGEVGAELDSLSQLIFEMEEKRHMAYMTKPVKEEPERKIDLNELESYIDEPAKKKETMNSRFSMTFESSPLGSPAIENPADDSNLLALFARMQPLRASLDFLPMRVSSFETRAHNLFPQACKELLDKRDRLEKNWSQLSDEAERLRRELSEDRWVIVFRNAGRQAQKMAESVERSIVKVQEGLDAGYQRVNPAALAKRIEGFEAKKMHYMPAIQRVLAIIQKGLKDRLTVNGEILRLNKDVSSRMRDLNDKIDSLQTLLEPMTARSNSKLRESISSIVSADRSLSSGTIAGTPGSSPASSIDLPSNPSQKPTPRYGLNGYTKPRGPAATRPPPLSNNNRRSTTQQRRPITPSSARSSISTQKRGPSPAPPSVYSQGLYRPPTAPLPARQVHTPVDKPRWSSTVRSSETAPPDDKRSSRFTPSGYYRIAPRTMSSSTMGPLRSPLSQDSLSSPLGYSSTNNFNGPNLRSFAERIRSPSANGNNLLAPVPYSKSRHVTAPAAGSVRSPSSLSRTGPPPVRPSSSLRSSKPGQALPYRINTQSQQQSQAHNQDAYSHNNQQHVLHGRPRKSEDSAVADLDQSKGTSMTSARSEAAYSEIDTEQDLDLQDDLESYANAEDNEYDENSTEVGSSPLSKRNLTQSSSTATGSDRRARRLSMLPLPVGSGRTSALGYGP